MLTDEEKLKILERAERGEYLSGYSAVWMCGMGLVTLVDKGHALTPSGRVELDKLRAKHETN